MNKLLVVVFENEKAADVGLNGLRSLHAAGDITLYATGILAKDAQGLVSVKRAMEHTAGGTAAGLAVGSLIGLLGGPLGLAVGAVTGSLVGAVRDFWVAGVGLDFIEDAGKLLQPGKAALVAEIEEEWVIPVDSVLDSAGGQVFRRTRTEVAEAQLDHDIAAVKAEIKALQTEAAAASGDARTKLQLKLTSANASLDRAMQRAQERADLLKQEAEAKAESLRLQMSLVKGEVKAKVETRMKRMKSAYHARGTKLSKAWSLTKEALAV